MNRPWKCCGFGDHDCTVSMPINGRVAAVDFCIHDIVAALNAANLVTVASCCGHKKMDSVVSLTDGRNLWITKGAKKCL